MLFFQAEEVSEARRFTTAKLAVTVRPVDASPPVVEATADEGRVEENSPIGTKVLDANGQPIRLSVSDPDLVSISASQLVMNRKYYLIWLIRISLE